MDSKSDVNLSGDHQAADNVEGHTSNLFDLPTDITLFEGASDSSENFALNPFALNQDVGEKSTHKSEEAQVELELPALWEEFSKDAVDEVSNHHEIVDNSSNSQHHISNSPFLEVIPPKNNLLNQPINKESLEQNIERGTSSTNNDDETLFSITPPSTDDWEPKNQELCWKKFPNKGF